MGSDHKPNPHDVMPALCEMCHVPLNGQGRLVVNLDVGNAWVCTKAESTCAPRHAGRTKPKK